ncbi:MAG: thermonuclease family protein [Candidatus Zixiibacteriota bacterium]|jgi:endonuclease YncB( thermonuclease family)
MPPSSKNRLLTIVLALSAVSAVTAVYFMRTGGWTRSAGIFGEGPGYRVVDGDTIEVEDVGPVRYIGIDAPERDEPYYDEATAYNAELLSRGELSLAYGAEPRDRYDRALAYVYVRDGEGRNVFVNWEMVRAGWAKTLEIPPNVRYADNFRRAENDARRYERGIWAKGDGVPRE